MPLYALLIYAKGKKKVKTLQEAVDQALADAKVQANAWYEHLQGNLARFRELAAGYETLFPDLQALAEKAGEDLEAQVRARIAEHEAEQRRAAETEEDAAPEAEDQAARTEATTGAAAEPTKPDAQRWQVVVELDSRADRAVIERAAREGLAQAGRVIEASVVATPGSGQQAA